MMSNATPTQQTKEKDRMAKYNQLNNLTVPSALDHIKKNSTASVTCTYINFIHLIQRKPNNRPSAHRGFLAFTKQTRFT